MNGLNVTFTPLADTYLPAELREAFIAAAEQSQWREPSGKMPFSPGLALKKIVEESREMFGSPVHKVAWSQDWEVHEDHTKRYQFDRMVSATILGVQTHRGQARWYFLDRGTEIVPLALVMNARPAAQGEELDRH